MSQFRFGISDRVNVPHFIDVQGVVHGVSDHILDGRRYVVCWLSGRLATSAQFSEQEMANANAPAVTAPAEPAKPQTIATLRVNVDTTSVDAALAKVKKLRAAGGRLKFKRKASPKRKR